MFAYRPFTHLTKHTRVPNSRSTRMLYNRNVTYRENNYDKNAYFDWSMSLINRNPTKRRRASVSVPSRTANERDNVHTAMALLWRSENSLSLRGVFRVFRFVQLRPLYISATIIFSSSTLKYSVGKVEHVSLFTRYTVGISIKYDKYFFNGRK